MMREAVVDVIGDGDTPYLMRIKLGRARIHVFFRGDNDPDCHDHANDFWTFPLVGYEEEYIDKAGRLQQRLVKPFCLHYRKAELAHRVLRSSFPPRHIVTLVWQGRERREWGFWVKHPYKVDENHAEEIAFEFVHWRTYLENKGRVPLKDMTT